MRLLFTCRYLKKNLSKKVSNLLKYMATRESVEKYTPEKNREINLGDDYQKVIEKLVRIIPESQSLFEYEDYTINPTAENAAELVAEVLEQYADKFYSREKIISYMAERPGVVKNGKHGGSSCLGGRSCHGLFSQSGDELILLKIMNEVKEHEGNIWTHVVSLRREDAERLGYNNPETWRRLILRNINTIAEQSKIDLHNLKWFAAFHNTAHHPHIHLVVYSQNPKQGYLTIDGIEKIRSKLANDIFKDELTVIYQKQTRTRNLIKEQCLAEMETLLKSISADTYENGNIPALIEKLSGLLKTVSGKKVYGYLPKPVKATVDEILSELAENPIIANMYEQWCEFEQEKYRTYSNRDKEIAPLERQDAFKSIKNMIIKATLGIDDFHKQELSFSAPERDENILRRSVRMEADDGANDFEITPDDLDFDDDETDGDRKASKVRTSDYIPMQAHQTFKSYTPNTTNAAFSLIKALGKMISDDYNHKWSGQNFGVDHKLKRVIDRQKEAMGLQIDRTMEQEY